MEKDYSDEELKEFAKNFEAFYDSENNYKILQYTESFDIEYGHQWDKYVNFLYHRNDPISNISRLITIKNEVKTKWEEKIDKIYFLLKFLKKKILSELSFDQKELASRILSEKIKHIERSFEISELLKVSTAIYFSMGIPKSKLPQILIELDLVISLFKSVTPQMITIPTAVKSNFTTELIDKSEIENLKNEHSIFTNIQKHYCALEAICIEYFSHPLSKVDKWDFIGVDVIPEVNDTKPGPDPDKYYPQKEINRIVKQLINIDDYIWNTEKKKGLYKKAAMAQFILDEKFINVEVKNKITETGMIARIDKALEEISSK